MSITPFVVSFIVNKHTNEIQSIDVLYAVNTKKEPAGSLSPEVSTPPTGSTISISNLLDYVNYYFPDILPKSVLKHFENKFYIHNMNLQNKKDTLPFKTEPRHESGLLSDNVSIYNLLNKLQNVNNNNTKFSLDVNFSYNELIKKPYIKKAMLIGIVKNSVNEPFVVSFIVNKHTNEIQSIDVLYAVNTKKEPAGSLSPEVSTPPTGSTISISNLLDCVNNCFLVM